jgi:hypothetical protein
LIFIFLFFILSFSLLLNFFLISLDSVFALIFVGFLFSFLAPSA